MDRQAFLSLAPHEQCAFLLKQTFANPNDAIRKECEKMLQTLKQDPNKFMELLISIMISPNSEIITKEIKDSAGSYLNLLVKTQATDDETKDNKNQLYQTELLFSAIIKDNLKLAQRVQLGTCLSNMLLLTNSDELKNSLLLPTLKAIEMKTNGMLGGLLSLQCITNTVTKPVELQQLYLESSKTLMDSGNNLVNVITQDLSAFSLMMNLPSEQKETATSTILLNLESLRVWTETIKNFSVKLGEAKGNLLVSLLKQQDLMVILMKILCIHINTDLQIKECIISTSGQDRIDDVINEIKIKVVKTVNVLTGFVFDFGTAEGNATGKFMELIYKLLPMMLSTIIKYCKTDRLDITKHLGNPSVECAVTEIMTFLTKVCTLTEFYHIFAEIKKILVIDVIFPLLRTIDSERELIVENPEEFVQLALDCCDKQLSETFKTQTAQFMERLCDHIDGTLTFVAVLAFNIMDYSFASNSPADIPENFKLLNEYKDCVLLSKTSAETRVETCLLVLSILSYTLPKRADLIMLLETTILKYQQFFFNTTDILIRSRYCLLISYYIENIFTEAKYKDAYALQIIYLIECVGLKSPDYDIVAIQACDGLKALFEEQELVPKIKPFIGDIVDKLTNYIESVTHNIFFEIIQEIVKLYSKEISEVQGLILLVINRLRAKIYFEISNGKIQKRNIIISNCWNIIRTICEQKVYIGCRLEIEQALTPLFNFMEKPEEIDFDDEIIAVMNSFIELTGVVSETDWTLLKTFPAVFEKYNQMLTSIFPSLNLMIVHGRDVIAKDSTIIDTFITLATKSIFCNDLVATEANHAEGALLLHLILQYLGEFLTNNQFERIILIAYEKLTQGIKKSFLRGRLFGVFLCCFMTRYKQTEEFLVSKNLIGAVFDGLMNNLDSFVSHYDRKVFVIGLTTILIRENPAPYIVNITSALFNCIVTMLKIEQAIDQAEQLRKKKKAKPAHSEEQVTDEEIPSNEQIISSHLKDFKKADESTAFLGAAKNRTGTNNHSTDMDDSDEDDDFDEEDEDDDDYGCVAVTEEVNISISDCEEEAQNLVDSMISDFKKRDEFEYFRNVILKIKEVNLQGLAAIVETLPEAKREYLKLVLQSHRIAVGPNGTETVARKIVSVKSKKSANDQKMAVAQNPH